MLRVSRNPVVDTVAKLAITAVGMFAFVFVVMVPLYDVLCDALGINGKTSGQAYTAVQSRMVTIQFVATNNEGMPWEFGPSVNAMQVHPGASNDTVFHARNPLPEAMVAQAIPSVAPSSAAAYLHKTECFCFEQQVLQPGETVEMPVRFILDPGLPQEVRRLTLAYTLFDVTDRMGDLIENAAVQAAR